MDNTWSNKTILCVDDELPVLESYKKVLDPVINEQISEILSLASKRGDISEDDREESIHYNLILASSGEEAVKIVQEKIDSGQKISGGFFDMRMPGGIDGYETIKLIKAIDPNIYCTVVTAYTDRRVTQIRNLFQNDHQDELLYFRKPFTTEELTQTAFNMVSSWNRKRKAEEHLKAIEKHKKGISQILHAVSVLSRVPPYSLQYLSSGLLFQLLGMVDGENGFIILLNEDNSVNYIFGVGRFENDDVNVESFALQKLAIDQSMSNQVNMQDKSFFIPLISSEKKLGAIHIESKKYISSILDQSILEVFRTQIVQLILNSRYYNEIIEKDKEALTDPLTGLFNRRFIQKRLQEELQRASRSSQRIAMMMIDLDDFKKVNDTYGHAAGDSVLKSIGKILLDSVRDYDLVGRNVETIGKASQFAVRFGGEEFCMVLLQSAEKGAKLVGERIRSKIENHNFIFDGNTISVTASIGVAESIVSKEDLSQDDYLDKLNKQADKALYKAKQSGKNKVEYAEC